MERLLKRLSGLAREGHCAGAAAGTWPSAAELEKATQRRYDAMLLVFAIVFTGGFAVAFALRAAWADAMANGAMVVIGSACGVWGWRTGRSEWPMRVLSGALVAMLAWKTLEQGVPLPAAGWWLSIMPFILAGAGLYAMAIGAIAVFVAIVSWLYFGPGAATIAPMAGVSPIRQYVAVVGSEALALVMILVAIRGRRDTARVIEATRAAALEAVDAKARFLAHMSHEIRTPLNGVIGTAELLRCSQVDGAQRAQLVGLLEQSARTLLTLVNDVLDLTKLDARKVVLEARPVQLRRLVFETNELFAVQAYNKGIELTSSCNPDVPRQFIGDATRLRQIVDNLVANAVKFTSSGGVHIHLSLEATEPARAANRVHHWIRIEVADSGEGIEPHRLSSLFKAFAQADASVTRRHGGTGLGLAISLELARLMGGRIDVASTPGRGSTFALMVPLDPAHSREAAPPARMRPRSDLLLASASRGVQRHLKTILQELGIEPQIVRSLPSEDEVGTCRLVLLDAPPLASLPEPHVWLQRHAAAGRRVVVITPLGADIAIGLPEDVLLLYKPVRRRSLQSVLDAIDAPGAHAALTPERAAARPCGGPHVLVAEDNAVNQIVVQAMLTEIGATSCTAANGRETLERLASERFDLVLMDMQMPELDGLSATRALRAVEPAGQRVPVVAMTANSLAEERAACRAAGMDDFLAKPFGMAELRAALRRWAARCDPLETEVRRLRQVCVDVHQHTGERKGPP